MEFTEVEPDGGCDCPGCGARHLARLHAARTPAARPAARGARRAAVLVAAVGTALGGATGAIAAAPRAAATDSPAPTTPQGEITGPFGGEAEQPRAMAVLPTTTSEEIVARAQGWVDQKVPYSMSRYWSDGYRQDCSGFISMAWGLGSSQTTWTLPNFADRIGKDDLQPGDALIYNDSANPQGGSHAVLFGGWTDSSHTKYTAYEQTSPNTIKRATPYAYWSHSGQYLPYRYRGISTGTDEEAFPGLTWFGRGQSNPYVKRLGELLVKRGAGRFYTEAPDSVWSDADRRATEAFQQAQGWTGAEADGAPGKDTWALLVAGRGRDVPPEAPLPPPPTVPTVPPVPRIPGAPAPAFPGTADFGPGRVDAAVQLLGRQLVGKGFGTWYTVGPSPEWTESDRRNVEAFQLAQGWKGAEADGYPGPHTWRLLFG
ncbi:peptidoglycan-binding protein [Kitasatospora sp. NPDC085879]|uniref:peptidoglycan-binding protein n=1 Tax=Kitasatospora sp. NPDC085879 TaxID=3154769 RepID=UPI00344AA621